MVTSFFGTLCRFVGSNENLTATDLTSLDGTDTDKDASDTPNLHNINNIQQATKRTKLDVSTLDHFVCKHFQ